MRSIIHYIFSLAAHLVSFGMGRRRSLSSIPLVSGKSIPIKPIAGWQIFIAVWVLQKLWKKYGDRVTDTAKQQAAKYHGPGSEVAQQFAGSGSNLEDAMVDVKGSSSFSHCFCSFEHHYTQSYTHYPQARKGSLRVKP